MKKINQLGETVEGYSIPVLNEREIRAAAGILFILMFTSIFLVVTQEKFTLLKYAIIFFLTDILIRVLVNPRFAPTLIMGRWIVRKQIPEYVGVRQKKFAWKIGIALASVMFALVVVVNSYSPISGLICFTCHIFLFFEWPSGSALDANSIPFSLREKQRIAPERFVVSVQSMRSRKFPGHSCS